MIVSHRGHTFSGVLSKLPQIGHLNFFMKTGFLSFIGKNFFSLKMKPAEG